MVYSIIPNLIPNLLVYTYNVELHHRTDGTFPLLRRMFELLSTLDKQPNLMIATYRGVLTTVFYRTLEYYTIYYIYDGTDAVIIDADINDDLGRKYNLRDKQSILTGFDYSEIPKNYKVYRTTKYDYGSYIYVQNKRRKKFNLYDPFNHRILLDLDYDEIIPYNMYDDGFYGKGYLYGDKGWYMLLTNGGHRYFDTKESNESFKRKLNRLISESLNKYLVQYTDRNRKVQYIRKALEEERDKRLEEAIGKSLHHIINEYTRKTVRT